MKAKRILSIVLSLAMLIAIMPAAMAASSVTDSEKMRSVLETVKSKVEIPAELTEFSSDSYSYGDNQTYSFTWNDEDYDNMISVSCDGDGRISYYNRYTDGSYNYEQKLPSVSRDDARKAAEEFLAKAAPETVEDENDRLVFSTVNSGYRSSYYVSFSRVRDGVKVSGNYASVSVVFDGDGKTEISDASINYDYDAAFEDAAREIDAPEDAYKAAFPAEMVYSRSYHYIALRNAEDINKASLIYRVKDGAPGYISAYTGEIVKDESYSNQIFGRNDAEMAMESAADTGSGSMLTTQELSELETVSGLYTSEQAASFLKSIPQLKIDADYTVTTANVYTSGKGDDKSYSLGIYLGSEDDKSSDIYSRFDAQSGRLTYYSNNDYIYGSSSSTENLTDEQKSEAYSQIDGFLRKALPDKISEFEDVAAETESSGTTVYKRMRRVVNGIPYIDDTILVRYSTYNDDTISERYTKYKDAVVYYSLNYNDKAEFAPADGALSADDAYEYLKKIAPVDKFYIYSDGEYRLVYGMDKSPVIDAFTGEEFGADGDIDYAMMEYDDISGHWCEEAVRALCDYGIGFAGESFNPDSPVTQEELLRLFTAGIKNKYYISNTADDIYEYCFRNDVLAKEARNDNASVSREKAFVYMVRLAGYGKIAELPDIYKVSYADGGQISDGLIGYAAILSGMGIIAGDGGKLRPRDSITRAEAVTMLYKYMK